MRKRRKPVRKITEQYALGGLAKRNPPTHRAAQEHFPGYQLCLAGSIEAHGDYVRFSRQTVGSAQAPLRIAGTDFAMIAGDGRLQSVVGFVDAAPAPVAG